MNFLVISFLFFLMYLYTIKPSFQINEIFHDMIQMIFSPLSYLAQYCQEVKKVQSFLVVIPIVIVILWLLSSADLIFGNMFQSILKNFQFISFDQIIGRIIWGGILFTYMGGILYYLVLIYGDRKRDNIKPCPKISNYTIKLLLTVLDVIYVIFDYIQIRSLIFHQGLKNIHYAQYARSGFFQLMFISLINVVIILLSKRAKQDTKYNQGMSLLMVGLTFIIIVSSFLRMYMYESAYGYTLLRLLVYVTLISEVILLIPTIFYIVNPKVNILKHYLIIIITCYTLLSLFPVDYFITSNNIQRYYKTGKIDVYYLENGSTDNMVLLCDFYETYGSENTDRIDLSIYLNEMYKRYRYGSIVEYNISRKNGMERLISLLK